MGMNGSTGARVGLVLAGVAVMVLEHVVPFGRLALYPFTLLATWVHEMGHGLGALVSGGGFDHLEIYRDASGLAYTRTLEGWHSAWVCAAGLLAPPVLGSIILASARGPKRGGGILMILAAALLFSLVFWVRSVVGIAAVAPLAALLAAFALWGGPARTMLAQFVGVLLALDTVARIDYLFMSSAVIGGERRTSDISGVAAGLGGPTLLWGLLIAGFDFVLFFFALRAAWSTRPTA